jgi:complement component 1 Q subcomponent-binding protein
MLIEAVAQDGEMIIDNVYFFADATHADPETSQQDWKRRAVYAGPPFGNLDEDLQILLERYLEERGVDVKLAQFVPDYIDYKEQKEYLRWLSSKSILFG